MTGKENVGSSGDYAREMEKRVERDRFVKAAHQKLLEAKHKDNVLRDANAEGTYRHTGSSTKTICGEELLFTQINLVPKQGVKLSDVNGVSNIVLEMPIKPWRDADEFVRDLHLFAMNDYESQFENGETPVLQEPMFVPDQVVFFRAVKESGKSIQGVVGTDCDGAIEFDNDVVTSPLGMDGGKLYTLAENEYTARQSLLLRADWYRDTPTFTAALDKYEPFYAGQVSSSSSTSAA